MPSYWILFGGIALLSWLVSTQLKRKIQFYSKQHLSNGLTGAEIAEKMLTDHGIRDVKVISTPGALTDHYNPIKKTVNLSQLVYNQQNVAAAAVAAHEVGHAIQHAKGYSWLKMRSKLVPIVQASSKFVHWILLAGIILLESFPSLLLIGIGMFAVTTLFSIITLPVEYDASRRAIAWLKNRHMVTQRELPGAKDALKWAARTYLVAAIGSIGTLMYYLMIYLRRRD